MCWRGFRVEVFHWPRLFPKKIEETWFAPSLPARFSLYYVHVLSCAYLRTSSIIMIKESNGIHRTDFPSRTFSHTQKKELSLEGKHPKKLLLDGSLCERFIALGHWLKTDQITRGKWCVYSILFLFDIDNPSGGIKAITTISPGTFYTNDNWKFRELLKILFPFPYSLFYAFSVCLV